MAYRTYQGDNFRAIMGPEVILFNDKPKARYIYSILAGTRARARVRVCVLWLAAEVF